jgi:hypothetical protein
MGRPPKPELAAEPLVRTTFGIPLSLHTRFKTLCAAKRMNMTDVLRLAVIRWVSESEREGAGAARRKA